MGYWTGRKESLKSVQFSVLSLHERYFRTISQYWPDWAALQASCIRRAQSGGDEEDGGEGFGISSLAAFFAYVLYRQIIDKPLGDYSKVCSFAAF